MDRGDSFVRGVTPDASPFEPPPPLVLRSMSSRDDLERGSDEEIGVAACGSLSMRTRARVTHRECACDACERVIPEVFPTAAGPPSRSPAVRPPTVRTPARSPLKVSTPRDASLPAAAPCEDVREGAQVNAVATAPGQALVSRRTLLILALLLVCVCGYGLSLFVNSISARLLGSSGVADVAASLMLNSMGRALALLLLVIPFLLLSGIAPWPRDGLSVTRASSVPVLVCTLGNFGFIAYFTLMEGGEVAVLSPMVGLYTVIPVLWGLVVRHESRSPVKLLGIGLSVAAVLMLGLSSNTFSAGGVSQSASVVVTKVIAFFACFTLWGVNDVLSAAVRVDVLTVAVASAVGQLANAAVYGFLAYVFARGRSHDLADDAPGLSLGHLGILAGNALAIIGWLAFVALGRLADASAFIPVVSLYTYIPVLLSYALLGERLSALQGVGLFVCVCAVTAISAAWGAGEDGGGAHRTWSAMLRSAMGSCARYRTLA